MSPAGPGTKKDCAVEIISNLPKTDTGPAAIMIYLHQCVSCEMVANRQQHKHESRKISIVGNRNLTTPSEDYNRLRQRVLR
jgi:hypothetical protein